MNNKLTQQKQKMKICHLASPPLVKRETAWVGFEEIQAGQTADHPGHQGTSGPAAGRACGKQEASALRTFLLVGSPCHCCCWHCLADCGLEEGLTQAHQLLWLHRLLAWSFQNMHQSLQTLALVLKVFMKNITQNINYENQRTHPQSTKSNIQIHRFVLY